MAGIGIRYVELAKSLCEHGFDVHLLSPSVGNVELELPGTGEIKKFNAADLAGSADVIIVQGHLIDQVLDIRGNTPVVVDLYDPYLVENMSYTDVLGEGVFDRDFKSWQRMFAEGDFFICGGEEQRTFYMGFLAALGRVDPVTVKGDPALRQLIDNVPFGLPREIPPHRRYLDVAADGRVNILFGGLYDWYDPWTVLEALKHKDFDRCRLIFVRNPNPDATPQVLFNEVVGKCSSWNWGGDKVEFLDWVPSSRRFDLLRDVDLLAAPHLDTLETRLSVRTRFIEAIAVGCPVIASDGGGIAKLMEEYEVGGIAAPGDVEGLRRQLRLALDGAESFRIPAARRRKFVSDFGMANLISPLVEFCSSPKRRRRSSRFENRPNRIRTRTDSGYGSRSFSILIPTHDRMDILPEVLEALARQHGPPRFDVVIVDDGSTDGTWEWLQKQEFVFPVKLLRQDNQGPAAARNLALDHAKGEYVILLGDDMVPDRFWLQYHAAAHARRGHEAGLVVVGQTDWHQSMPHTAFLDFLDDSGWQFAFDKIEDPEDVGFNFFYGSNISLPSKCLATERFNTEFPYPAWEDTELGYRLKLQGSRFVFEPAARTYHAHKTTIVRFAQRQTKAGYCAVVFCRLHPELESFLWPSRDRLDGASGPVVRNLRKWMAGCLERLPIELTATWNQVLCDHYVKGIRDCLMDHGISAKDPQKVIPSRVFPITFHAGSPLLKHNSGRYIDGAWACRAGSDEAGHCVYGPYLSMHESQSLEIRFHLRIRNMDGRVDIHQPCRCADVAVLDVYDANSDTVLAESNVQVTDIVDNGYVFLRFASAPDQNLEFRTYWHGHHSIAVQRIELHEARP